MRWSGLWLAIVAAVLPMAATSQGVESPVPSFSRKASEGDRILVMVRLAPPHYRPNTAYGGGYGDDAAQTARLRIARRIAKDHRLQLAENWPMPILGVDCFVMNVPDARAASDVAAIVAADRDVSWSQPLNTFEALERRRRTPYCVCNRRPRPGT